MKEELQEIILGLIQRFLSRKFLLAVLGVAVVFGVPLTDAQIAAITILISAFIGAEGAADYIKNKTEPF